MVRLTAICLLLVHAALLYDSARRNFVTIDEAAHLAAGVSCWRSANVGLYRVNPPLWRMVAVAPTMMTWPELEIVAPPDRPGSRPEFPAGRRFASSYAPNYAHIFFVSRLAGMCWSLLGGWLVYRWTSDLSGSLAGCLSLAIWCFAPEVLAHAPLITPDVPAAVSGLAACYVFWKYLRRPTWTGAVWSGFVLGIAQSTKFTLVLLYPVCLMLWIAFRLAASKRAESTFDAANTDTSPTRQRGKGSTSLARRALINSAHGVRRSGLAAIGHGLIIVLLGWLLINAGYGFQDVFRPLGTFPFVSKVFAGEQAEWTLARGHAGNRFTTTWLGSLPVPLPADYLRGIDVQRADFETPTRPSYLAGEWRYPGWWYWYLYAMAVKVPLGIWGLVLSGVVLALWRYPSSMLWLDRLVLWLPAVTILAVVSSQVGMTCHLRYVLPALPFIAIATGTELAALLQTRRLLGACFVGSLLLWSAGSTLSQHPHHLSYFNELADGPDHGSEHLVDSCIDWGQDLLFLKAWLDQHPEAEPLHLAYFNVVDPHVAGIQFVVPPFGTYRLPVTDPDEGRRLGPHPGYHAVSVNLMRGMRLVGIPDGKGSPIIIPPGGIDYFRYFQPIAKAGYSIFIYRITLEEANAVRARLGLPLLGDSVPGSSLRPESNERK